MLRAALVAGIVSLLALSAFADSARQRTESPSESRLGIDHVPVAVRDLARASDTYRKLGFTLKPGRAHDNGIRNAHIKFANGPYIELITADRADDATSAEYRRLMAAGEGPAYLALKANDLEAVSAQLAAVGQSTMFEDGLLTLKSPELRYLFFGSGSRSRTDLPAHYRHENGAMALTGVWLAADDSSPLLPVLRSLGAVARERTVLVPDRATATVLALNNGEITVLPADRHLLAGRAVIGIVLQASDLQQLQRRFAAAGIDPAEVIASPDHRRVILSPRVTHGLWLEFRAP